MDRFAIALECSPFLCCSPRGASRGSARRNVVHRKVLAVFARTAVPASGWTRGFTCRVAIVLGWPRGSFCRCLLLRPSAPPLSTSPTTVGSTVQAHCDRPVAELERGVTETGTQRTDAPPVETLHDVRQSIPRGVPHSRPHLHNCGVRCRSSEGCHQPFPPCSLVPSPAFLDVREENVPSEGLARLAPTARALVAAAFALRA